MSFSPEQKAKLITVADNGLCKEIAENGSPTQKTALMVLSIFQMLNVLRNSPFVMIDEDACKAVDNLDSNLQALVVTRCSDILHTDAAGKHTLDKVTDSYKIDIAAMREVKDRLLAKNDSR